MRRIFLLFFGLLFLYSKAGAEELPDALRYTIKAEFDDVSKSVTAQETVRFVNTTGQVLSEIHFNIFLNKQYTQEERRRIGFYQNYFKTNMFPFGLQSADFKIMPSVL